ncbi:MAG: 6-carboxytetrahydropterin synthase QueD [Bacteroidetes bacterium CG02_land_8_20_14_3_00_31_25]|nr:6-carboxytetrahydropterin synthase [Bacteroidota bacterium]PIV62174.1 MAG: 6-carboxytetrahydropterin synthase QueD [Bacteroidetes bacterium CG02_land_8_20_14_3_00_31_25]
MAQVRVTKEFKFEMAHALWNYDGLCKNIHGHSYILYVTVLGEPIADNNNKKLGMVIDFGDLKKIVNQVIVTDMDHSLVVSEKSNYTPLFETEQMFERHHILPYQPTCENMVVDFAERIKKLLPESVKLHSVRLYETATSYAEWNVDDNEVKT